jgi:hypothetical protein
MLPTTTLRKVLLIGLLVLLIGSLAGPASAGSNVWTSNGPEGGRINVLAIDPTMPTTLYAGTNGGVAKSTNDHKIILVVSARGESGLTLN